MERSLEYVEPHLALLTQFTAGPTSKYQVDGRSYRFGLRGARTVSLIMRIVKSRELYSTSLLDHRERLAEIIDLGDQRVLTFLLTQAISRNSLALLIWLRGRCPGNFGTSIVASYRTPFFPASVRRQVAKALKRMQAWSTLHTMASCDDDARVRAVARTKRPALHGERMTSFLGHVAHLKSSSEPQPLYVSPAVELSKAWRLKSSEFIRMILERIHRLVRSGA